MTDFECDFLALARRAASSGDHSARRFVCALQIKYKGTDLGEHLNGVCVRAGLPVDVESIPSKGLAVAQPWVLIRVEVLTQLEHAAESSPGLLSRYLSAFNQVTGNSGSLQAEHAILSLASEGQGQAARLLAEMLEADPRSTYAASGAKLLRSMERRGTYTAFGKNVISILEA